MQARERAADPAPGKTLGSALPPAGASADGLVFAWDLAAPRAGGLRLSVTRVVAAPPPILGVSRPRSANVRVWISFERAAMMPFRDG